MGLPPGWVTGPDVAALGVPRSAMLRMIGNGVVPRQAEAAARILLDRVFPPDQSDPAVAERWIATLTPKAAVPDPFGVQQATA